MDKNIVRNQFTTQPSITRLRGELADSRARHDEMLDRFDAAVPTEEIPGGARKSNLMKKAAVYLVAAALGAAVIHEAANAAGSAEDHAPQPPAHLVDGNN